MCAEPVREEVPHPNPESGQRATFELPGDPGSSPQPTVTTKNLSANVAQHSTGD